MKRQFHSTSRACRPIGNLVCAALTLLAVGSAHSDNIETIPTGGAGEPKVDMVGIVRFAIPRVVPDEYINDFQNVFVSLMGFGLGIQGVPTVERNEEVLGDIDRELGRRLTGYLDRDQAAQAGRKLGARWILTGLIEQVEQGENSARITIRAKLINVETGVPIALKSVVGEGKVDRRRAQISVIGDVLDHMPHEPKKMKPDDIQGRPIFPAIMRASVQLGREIAGIASVRGRILAVPERDEALIDAGMAAGIKPGNKFVVYRRTPITAPDGTIAGYKRKELGAGEALHGQVDENRTLLKITSRTHDNVEIRAGDYACRRALDDNELTERLDEKHKTVEVESKQSRSSKKQK